MFAWTGSIAASHASAAATVNDFKKRIASLPPDEQVYELWRFWLVDQPPDVQKLFDHDDTKPKGFELYRKRLQAEGDPAAEIERKLRIIDKDGEHQQGWDTTGYDPADKAVALARETAAKAGVKLNAVVAKDADFDMGVAKWDLILLSYVEIRDNAQRVARALAPGGIVVAEYFHQDGGNAPGGFADNKLLRLFETLRVIRYEDTEAVADFGMQKTRLVRLCAEKRR